VAQLLYAEPDHSPHQKKNFYIERKLPLQVEREFPERWSHKF